MPEYRLILQGVYGQGGPHKLTSNSNKVGNIKTQLINARNIKNKGTKITKNQIDIKIGPKIFNNSHTLPTNGMIMVVKKMPIIAEQKSNEPINNFNANIPKNIPKKNSCIQVNIRENGQNKKKYLSIYLILKQLENLLNGLPEKESEGKFCKPFVFQLEFYTVKYTDAQFDKMIKIIEALYDHHIKDDYKIKNRRCIVQSVLENELPTNADDPVILALEFQRKTQHIPNNANNKYPKSVKDAAYKYLCNRQPMEQAYFNMYLKPKPPVTKLINPLKSEDDILTKEEVLAILKLLKDNQEYQFNHPQKTEKRNGRLVNIKNNNGNPVINHSLFQGMNNTTLKKFIEQLHSIIANKEMFMVELREYFKKHPLEVYGMNNLDEIIRLGINSNRLFQDSIRNNNPVEFAYKQIHQIMGINISHRNLSPVHTSSPVNRGPPPPYRPPAYNPNWRPPSPPPNKITFERFIELVNEQLQSEPIAGYVNTVNKITNIKVDFNIRRLYDEIIRLNIPENGIKRHVKDRIPYIMEAGGQKEYIKLQSGGKRLVRYGKRGGRYYMKDGKKKYIK